MQSAVSHVEIVKKHTVALFSSKIWLFNLKTRHFMTSIPNDLPPQLNRYTALSQFQQQVTLRRHLHEDPLLYDECALSTFSKGLAEN